MAGFRSETEAPQLPRSRTALSLALFFCLMCPAFSFGQIHHTAPAENAALPEFNRRPAYIEKGDTIPVVALRPFYLYGPTRFQSKREYRQYMKLINDVKYCLPLAKIAAATMIETTEYMLKYIPDEKEREKHLRKMERELIRQYEPVLRKMTYSRGKILIKLIVRECDSTPYEIIRAYLGNFAAGFWQGVAKLFTADLKAGYHPEKEDRLIEMIAIRVEQGEL